MGKNEKVIVMVKDELGGVIMKDFVDLGRKMYLYLKDDDIEEK